MFALLLSVFALLQSVFALLLFVFGMLLYHSSPLPQPPSSAPSHCAPPASSARQ